MVSVDTFFFLLNAEKSQVLNDLFEILLHTVGPDISLQFVSHFLMALFQSVNGSLISGYIQMNHSYILCLWYSVCKYTTKNRIHRSFQRLSFD